VYIRFGGLEAAKLNYTLLVCDTAVATVWCFNLENVCVFELGSDCFVINPTGGLYRTAPRMWKITFPGTLVRQFLK
jgi:hypothetical protein